MDCNELIEFAKYNGISIKINYWEASDEYELETISAAKSECFYMKRCSSSKYFIEQWNKHVSKEQ